MHLPTLQSWFEHLTRKQIFLLLALFGLLAYANAVNHPFVHDDVVYIQHNPRIADFDIQKFFEEPSAREFEFTKVNQYYRPLLEYINKAIFRIVGLNPHGFHFVNVALHIVNSFLVFMVVDALTRQRKGVAFVTALFFLVHPVQSEAVACISGISNLVVALFTLASLYCYVLSRREEAGRHNARWYACSLLLFVMALLSKEQSVVLPVLIVAYELCFGGPWKNLTAQGKKVGAYFLLLAAYFLMRKIMFGSTMTQVFAMKEEYALILLAIPRSILMYLGLIAAPHNLHYYRSLDILKPALGPMIALILIIIAAVIAALKTPHPGRTWILFGLSWFAVVLLPASNIIPLINEYSLILTAEHFLYLPMIGIVLAVAGYAGHCFQNEPHNKRFTAFFAICALLTAVYVPMTVKQNTYWRGEIPLFERTLQFEPNFGRVRFLLGQAYARAGRFEQAVEEDRKALAIMEGYAARMTNKRIRKFYDIFIRQINHHIGVCYVFMGDYEQALPYFLKALADRPDNALYNYSVGNVYLHLDKVKEAIGYFETIAAHDHTDLQAMSTLAVCYEHIGNWEKAEANLRRVAELSGSASARANLERFLTRRQNAQQLIGE